MTALSDLSAFMSEHAKVDYNSSEWGKEPTIRKISILWDDKSGIQLYIGSFNMSFSTYHYDHYNENVIGKGTYIYDLVEWAITTGYIMGINNVMTERQRDRVINTILIKTEEFKKLHGREAECIFLTPEMRKTIEDMTYDDIGSIATDIKTMGIEEGLPIIFGLKVKSWDEEKIRVE